MRLPLVGFVDIPTLIGAGIALLVIYGFISRFLGRNNNVYSGLVMTRYDFDLRNPTGLVQIEGRRTGLWAWIMSLIGLGKKYSIIVTARFVSIVIDGPSDHDEFNVPISMLAVSYWGLRRPTFWLIVGIVLIMAAIPAFATIVGGIVLLLLGIIVLYFQYWRGQMIEVRVSPGDGSYYGFGFYKRSAGTMEKAAKTASLINKLTYTVATVKGSE